MNLVRTEDDKSVFHLSAREKRLLFEILKLYPVIPTAHHKLTRAAGQMEAGQKLLEEALVERKQQLKKQLLAMLADEHRFAKVEGGFLFTLTQSQMEWLLQVLNDIRVGSWLILGEPDEKKSRPVKLTDRNALHYAAMEFCGYIQMSLLEAGKERG